MTQNPLIISCSLRLHAQYNNIMKVSVAANIIIIIIIRIMVKAIVLIKTIKYYNYVH